MALNNDFLIYGYHGEIKIKRGHACGRSFTVLGEDYRHTQIPEKPMVYESGKVLCHSEEDIPKAVEIFKQRYTGRLKELQNSKSVEYAQNIINQDVEVPAAISEKPISHKQCFMEIAKITARRSKDPRSQNGAAITSSDNRILSTGYNGFLHVEPKHGNNDEIYSWEKDEDFTKDRLSYVVHAEANALLNYRGIHRDMVGGTLYCTQIPCNECAKLIAQSGIKKVIYLYDENKPRVEVTKKILKYAGVELEKYEES